VTTTPSTSGSPTTVTATSTFDAGSSAVRPADPTDASLGDLVGRLTENYSRLMRQEVALARTEIRQEAVTAGKGAGMLAGAGVFGLLMLIMLSLALGRWLSEYMDIGWAYLIVAVLWAVVAGVLASMGRKKLQETNPTPERTVATVKEIPDTLKGHSA
jgi:hypothetical protein